MNKSSEYDQLLMQARLGGMEDLFRLRQDCLIIDGQVADNGRMTIPLIPDFVVAPIKLNERLVGTYTICYCGLRVRVVAENGQSAYLPVPAAGLYLVEGPEKNGQSDKSLILIDNKSFYRLPLCRRRDLSNFEIIKDMIEDMKNRFEGEEGEEEEIEERGEEVEGMENETAYDEILWREVPDEYDLALDELDKAIRSNWVGGRIVRMVESGDSLFEAVGVENGRNNLAMDF